MRVLLDENFPLALVGALRKQGYQVDHIILLGLRGTLDETIVRMLDSEELLFLTQDQEFLARQSKLSSVIVSSVSQTLPIRARLEIWKKAVGEYFAGKWRGKVFEVFDDGELHPWEDDPG